MAPSRPPNHAGGRMDIKQTNSGTTTQVCKDSKAVVKELTTPTPPLLLLLIQQHPPDTQNTPTPATNTTIVTVSCKTCQHAIGWMCTEK
ncbi:hypothetical protein ILYODFUR_003919 [Ilyodon furcidens]|uniref:Uncharacterized protein n=1 Tax=Ilyodon furcidens TaxID=33524 RepID=A0ABV0UNT1_9TELE